MFVFCVFTGKVSIRKDDLCKYSGKEHWFSLHPVDPNSEVQVIQCFKCTFLNTVVQIWHVYVISWSRFVFGFDFEFCVLGCRR